MGMCVQLLGGVGNKTTLRRFVVLTEKPNGGREREYHPHGQSVKIRNPIRKEGSL